MIKRKEPPRNEAWARALDAAKRRWEVNHLRDLTYDEIGASMARVLGREKPIAKQQVYAWFNGMVPATPSALALAYVLEADPFELGLLEPEEEATGEAAPRRRRRGNG